MGNKKIMSVTSNLGMIMSNHNDFDIDKIGRNFKIVYIDEKTGIVNYDIDIRTATHIIYESDDTLIKESIDGEFYDITACITATMINILFRIIGNIENFKGKITIIK